MDRKSVFPSSKIRVIILLGEDRKSIKPGLSPKATARIEQLEEAGRRASASLGNIQMD